jgi:hypothetical protein
VERKAKGTHVYNSPKISLPLAQHIARVFKPGDPQTAPAVPSQHAGGNEKRKADE